MDKFTPLQFQTIMYYSLDDKNYEHYLKLQKSISKLKKQYLQSGEEDVYRSLQLKQTILELIVDRVFLNV